MLIYSKITYINAIMWYFNLTREKASMYYKELETRKKYSRLNIIAEGYNDQMSRAFYND